MSDYSHALTAYRERCAAYAAWQKRALAAALKVAKGSYFEDCPRDGQGRCKPGGGGGKKPTGKKPVATAASAEAVLREAREARAASERLFAELAEKGKAERMPPSPRPEPAPQPKLKDEPARPPTEAGRKTAESLHASIGKAEGLSDGQRKAYGEAVDRVAGNVPDAAHALIQKNLKSAHFYPDGESMSNGVWDRLLAARPAWLRVGDYLFRSKQIDALEREAFVLSNHSSAGSFFEPDQSLHLDGGDQPIALGLGLTGPMPHAHVYAHELAHAVDGPDRALSGTPAWRRAWEGEIAVPGHPLTSYAASADYEGFAEFGRALYGGGVDRAEVQRRFPQCSKFFQERGLWPNG